MPSQRVPCLGWGSLLVTHWMILVYNHYTYITFKEARRLIFLTKSGPGPVEMKSTQSVVHAA